MVVGGAETVDFVLTRAEAAGSPYTPAQVHAVLDAQMTYLEAIGAVGPGRRAPRTRARRSLIRENPSAHKARGCGFISGTRERRWSS